MMEVSYIYYGTRSIVKSLSRVSAREQGQAEFQLLGFGLRSAQSAVYSEVLLPPPNSQRFRRVF